MSRLPQHADHRNTSIAAALTLFARDKKIKQATIAKKMRMSQSHISRLLTNKSAMTVSEFFGICQAIGVSEYEALAEAAKIYAENRDAWAQADREAIELRNRGTTATLSTPDSETA